MLFAMGRRDGNGAIELGTPLSWSEPPELRLVLYLLLGAVCGSGAFIGRIIFGLVLPSGVAGWLLVVLIALGFLANIAFFYAAAGSLLQAALGTRGRPPYWFSRLLSPVDGLVMDAGDFISGLLFRPAPVQQVRRPRRRIRYEDELDYEPQPPVRRRARRPVYVDMDEEDELDEVVTARPRPAPEPMERPRPVRRPVAQDDDSPLYRDSYPIPEDEEGTARRSVRKAAGAQPRDFAKERLLLAIEEYESTLTAGQREKLREMRSLIESMRQYA